ncbi:MAG: hypothetical protein ABIV47_09310 [Roseiflexaceae bacterium]
MPLTHLAALDPHARDLAERSLVWLDRYWDPSVGLFQMPDDALYEDGQASAAVHLVRESAWYALGLLLRNADGDIARAIHAVDALLGYQFDAPGQPYHGTWYRSPHEPPPPAHPLIWVDYDPNWREFIGTTLALMLIEYEALLPADLVRRIDLALRRAIAGTLERNVPAGYTNIALMTAFLLQFGAARFNEPGWVAVAERLAGEIVARFRVNSAFDEYNSPTYYGIDLYALALWRSYAESALLRDAGAELEAALWRDIAQFYHAGMRNIAGPYDRSYGMDLRQYVACLGMWIWLATGYQHAPFPDLTAPLDHGWDFAVAPVFALLGLRMPVEARPHFVAFQGQRQIEHVIANAPLRIATAWIGATVMLGAEESGSSQRVNDQFHPATIHWLIEGDRVGWIRLRHTASVDARAEPNQLALVCTAHAGVDQEFIFQVAVPQIELAAFQPGCWDLPGLTVRVETNAGDPTVVRTGKLVELRYRVIGGPARTAIHFTLRTNAPEARG